MTNTPGIDIETIINQVKRSILQVQNTKDTTEMGIEIQKVELTLKAVVEKSIGGDIKVKIPILDVELGTGGSHSQKDTQTIQMTLVPDAPVVVFAEEDFSQDLTQAILEIRTAVKNAAQQPPLFSLQSASIELNFVVTTEGKIAVVAQSKLNSETTHTVKVSLGP